LELSKGVYSRERTTDAISAFAVAGQMLMMNTKPTHYTFLRKIIGVPLNLATGAAHAQSTPESER
jgi:hypothetical protein